MSMDEWRWKNIDGLEYYARCWMPETPPRALVWLVHGLGEHINRYPHVAAAFNAAGYAVAGFDLPGHGHSAGPRGHLDSLEALWRDMDAFAAQLSQRFSGLPLFIFGQSLGGILVLNYTLRRKPPTRGVIASASGLRTALEKQTAKVWLVKSLGAILPSLALPSGLDVNGLSRDPAVIAAYQADPLVHEKISLGLANNVMLAIAYAFENAPSFPAPLLLSHGAEDPIAYAHGSQEFSSKVPGEVTLKIWEGLRHEMHNEPEQKTVIQFYVDWLNAHL